MGIGGFYFQKTRSQNKNEPNFFIQNSKIAHLGILKFTMLTLNKKLSFFTQKEKKNRQKHEVFYEKLKTVLPALISGKKNIDLQLHKIFKHIRLLLCNDSFLMNIHLYINYSLYYYLEIERQKKSAIHIHTHIHNKTQIKQKSSGSRVRS